MTWRDIPGFPGYEVSDAGCVRKGTVPLSAHTDRDGYQMVNLRTPDGGKRHRGVHRLVLMAFHGPPDRGQVSRHINGVRDDNRPENLCWGTQAQNIRDRDQHGNAPRGHRNGSAKLDEQAVRDIRILARNGAVHAHLARKYGVSKDTIDDISRRKSWAWLTDEPTPTPDDD